MTETQPGRTGHPTELFRLSYVETNAGSRATRYLGYLAFTQRDVRLVAHATYREILPGSGRGAMFFAYTEQGGLFAAFALVVQFLCMALFLGLLFLGVFLLVTFGLIERHPPDRWERLVLAFVAISLAGFGIAFARTVLLRPLADKVNKRRREWMDQVRASLAASHGHDAPSKLVTSFLRESVQTIEFTKVGEFSDQALVIRWRGIRILVDVFADEPPDRYMERINGWLAGKRGASGG